MRDAEQSLNLSTGTVELELPMLGADARAQDWRLANAGLDSRAATSAMRTGSRSPTFVADTAFFQDSIAYASGTARRPQGSQLPWIAQHHQMARAEVAHEFELPDLRTPRPMPTQVPGGSSAGKSGGCACGGKCGGKSSGSCNGACQGKSGGGSGCGCSNKGAAVHGASASNPWPLDDARHNLVLLAQELLLLEGHLADPERRCPSCVTKHALTVRALADEGRRLDGGGQYQELWSAAQSFDFLPALHHVRGLRQHATQRILRPPVPARVPARLPSIQPVPTWAHDLRHATSLRHAVTQTLAKLASGMIPNSEIDQAMGRSASGSRNAEMLHAALAGLLAEPDPRWVAAIAALPPDMLEELYRMLVKHFGGDLVQPLWISGFGLPYWTYVAGLTAALLLLILLCQTGNYPCSWNSWTVSLGCPPCKPDPVPEPGDEPVNCYPGGPICSDKPGSNCPCPAPGPAPGTKCPPDKHGDDYAALVVSQCPKKLGCWMACAEKGGSAFWYKKCEPGAGIQHLICGCSAKNKDCDVDTPWSA